MEEYKFHFIFEAGKEGYGQRTSRAELLNSHSSFFIPPDRLLILLLFVEPHHRPMLLFFSVRGGEADKRGGANTVGTFALTLPSKTPPEVTNQTGRAVTCSDCRRTESDCVSGT